TMPQSNAKQAMVPKNGTVFKNLNGTAPGLAYETGAKCVIMLPGPPREMEPMFLHSVKPYLEKYSDGIILSHTIRTFGIGESAMAEAVADLLESDNPTLAPYAKEGEAFLRLTARAKNIEEAESIAKPVLAAVQNRLGDCVYGIDVDNLQTKLVEMLKERSLKIATAESCTAGYLSKRITEPAGASKVFECGIVAYSNDIKQQILGVSGDILKTYGAVSKETAVSMAKGVRYLACADIGIGVTGIAGPGTDSDNKPIGLTYIALTDGDRTLVEEIPAGRSNDREYNRLYAASKALFMAIDYLRKFR
ncbi:MAG TPA: nicotinamide-nucleotide amidohydrolase family protein, partial [Oscillospiraceae bacterium]|nr:nicotinamide-nucleotide amidohydrolase family protein [Oscillospiraceae bacterium]